jgi:undecaprenyl-diphosphatase
MNPFDLTLFNFIHAPAGRWFLLDWLDIFVAVYLAYLLIAGFIYLLIKEKNIKKRAYALAWAVLALIVSRGIITELIQLFWNRERPFSALGIESVFNHANVQSFPSGHMAAYATFILPVFYLNRKWGWAYLGSVIAMGVARVYGAVHWPTDILGGFAIALAVSYGVKRALFKEDIAVEKMEEAEATKTIE